MNKEILGAIEDVVGYIVDQQDCDANPENYENWWLWDSARKLYEFTVEQSVLRDVDAHIRKVERDAKAKGMRLSNKAEFRAECLKIARQQYLPWAEYNGITK